MDRFFAVISRMKYIDRWALMRNTINENISEHSLETAFIAHALALIKCIEERKMGNTDFLSAEKATLETISKLDIPEVDVFMKEFIPAYDLTLDALSLDDKKTSCM